MEIEMNTNGAFRSANQFVINTLQLDLLCKKNHFQSLLSFNYSGYSR